MGGLVTFAAFFNDPLIDLIKIKVRKEHQTMLDELVTFAIEDAPVGETRILASPVTIKKVNVAGGETNVVAETEGKPYPTWVEHGTFDHMAQPFFWPAYKRAKKRFFARMYNRGGLIN